jgi:hypothetical protein
MNEVELLVKEWNGGIWRGARAKLAKEINISIANVSKTYTGYILRQRKC